MRKTSMANYCVDYSRFDKIIVSDSEGEESEEERSDPGVYRVGQGESVTIPGRNVTINGGTSHKSVANPTPKAILESQTPLEKLCRNGAALDDYLWSQEARAVFIHVLCEPGTRAADVTVNVTEEKLSITTKANGTILEKLFFAAVEAPEEVEDLDWEIADAPIEVGKHRVVSVSLKKKDLFGTQVVMWWKSAFKGDPQVDSAKLKDRSVAKKKGNEKFAEAFKNAQEAFKHKIANEPDNRIEVQIDED
eukprot:m.143967 g.143967  ORF g.143967 m.143967 type:complete len:249 (+) comp30344_c0_seq2:3-749(+)